MSIQYRPAGTARFRSIAVACLVLAFVLLSASMAVGEPYRLGVHDKLRIRVVEWRAGQAEYVEWTALGAEYAVNPAGAISIPLLGEVPATGRTTEEVAAEVSQRLQQRTGLMTPPDTSVEIVSYGPIVVVGDVQHPGEYAFRPGLTVLHAIGLAGGLHRPGEAGLIRLERDRISATGLLESARRELRRVLVRRARLEAELAESATIKLPEELKSDPDATALIAEEEAIMVARRDALQSQLLALSDLQELYAREGESLAAKLVTQRRQIELAKRELDNINTLINKGLAVTSRETGLERILADLDAKLLDLETATVRAEQEVRKAKRDSVDLEKDRKTKIVSDLQEVRSRIDQLRVQIDTSTALIEEASITAPILVLKQAATSVSSPIYSILRTAGVKSVRIAADEASILQPSDVLHIERSSFRRGAEMTAEEILR